MVNKWVLSSALLVGSASLLLASADDMSPTTQPFATTQPVHHRRANLTKPWSELSDLTPDQKTKIEQIHEDANEQTKKIHAKEEDDIKALLTPAQLDQLKNVLMQAKTDAREHNAERRHEPTTEPMH